ncbi:methyltransferase domain-containing protein [Limnohabitans sp. INBF002]|uniref:methyltransferase domain-containing protein n=1 Tax=Limnohabitans sp. INBF002 TaxID=2986280 RepID=UPI0023776028|nr:methyltransferase domain-containing protein [Limnohabitans sp. INBF002]BDU52026.1 hypothetical protein LINBF2_02610 [Limnohabitans sp. INBF002]
MSEYNVDFYEKMSGGAEASAKIMLPSFFQLISPKVIIDLGCGVGCWLRVAKKLGCTAVLGFDGAYVNKNQLQIDESEFFSVDLLQDTPDVHKADLALCMEVAEHLPASRADAIVKFLCASADVVLFGAAIPGQGGAHHINEQWQSYWVEKFSNKGFSHSIKIRDEFWNDQNVAVWYKQNSLVFINSSRADLLEKFEVQTSQGIIDVVHPDLYSLKMRRYGVLEKILTLMQRYLNYLRSVIR